ncbi:MAG TPA: hypothetical protein VFZ52_18765 [Chryseolinea sp.]
MNTKYTIVVLILLLNPCLAQDVPLFQSQEPVNLRITGSIKSIKKNSNDSTFVTGKFLYEQDGQWIEVPGKARVRGNFRLKNCYFPPMKVKFKKDDVSSTLFSGNKSLKLVLPCETSSDNNGLIRKEYLCYQLYKIVSPYYFQTRLANLELKEVSKKKPREYKLLTFFVEDNTLVAERSSGKVIETKGIAPTAFDEKQSLRNDYFQYMIGNADWSAVFQHNSNTLYVDGKYIPLSYDFDMSGFVNASYAKLNPPQLGTGNPRDRVYRGFCKSKQAMQEVRMEFLEKESAAVAIIENEAANFTKYELNDMKVYLAQFFDILKSDDKFGASIVGQCRTK